jgi:prepilin-type N-terminal cleavage/methylation domain-containing protein
MSHPTVQDKGMEIPTGHTSGFTLIELSIVLVIIGLIVGGVLVGQDLIRAAYVRAQITQIERYNTAVNTFYLKYQALPGDMNQSVALANGFGPRGGGDGNGVLGYTGVFGPIELFDWECAMFWADLSHAGLIEGSFNTATMAPGDSSLTVSWTQVPLYMPPAKIGGGNFVYVWSGGWKQYFNEGSDGVNYFGLSTVQGSAQGMGPMPLSDVAITVQQAYSIDRKVDDGYPQSGRVLAMYDGFLGVWAGAGNSEAGTGQNNNGDFSNIDYGPVTDPGDVGDGGLTSSQSCYDGSRGVPEAYSTQINGGAGANCALSFRMQGGD